MRTHPTRDTPTKRKNGCCNKARNKFVNDYSKDVGMDINNSNNK